MQAVPCPQRALGSAAVPRRALLCAWGAAGLLLPAARSAVPGPDAAADRPRRIGVLGTDAGDADGIAWQAFIAELKRRGHVEGQHFVLLRRYAPPGQADRLAALAAELVAAPVDLIYAVQGSPSAIAAARATSTIPIVFYSSADPVGLGLVQSLSRPGGNATGSMPLGYEAPIKGLDLLAEAAGRIRRLVFFVPPDERQLPGVAGFETRLRAATQRLGAQLVYAEAASTDAVVAQLPQLRRHGADAAMVFDFSPYQRQHARIADACIAQRLPTYGYAWAGFLLHITQDREELARNAARQVDRILGGAKPADLPVEQLTVLQLVLNLRTARAIGLRVPPSLVARASEVIE